MKKDNCHIDICFIVTSVIYYKDKELSYSKVRSAFSSEERAVQTLQTINSIRMKVPQAKIILVEMGLKKELPFNISELVDQYIYSGDNYLVRLACDSKYKGLGEVVGLIYGIKHINFDSEFYFKISGRYYLNEKFDISKWNIKGFSCKFYNNSISTRLYGFSIKFYKIWYCYLWRSILPLMKGKSVENVFYEFLNLNKVYEMKILGVSGNIGPNGEEIIE